MQQLASAIVFEEPKQPDLIWKEDMTGLSYCDIIVELKSLRSGLHGINDRVAQLLANISGGTLLPCSLPENFQDPMSKGDIGHTFLNHPSLTQYHLQIVEHMLKGSEFNIIAIKTPSNKLLLSQPKMIHILVACAEINKLLMVLMHMVCSQPPHASEEVDLCIRNGHRHRNVFMVLGNIWRVVNATKTEKFIPALLPPEIGQHLFYYLVHIRPLEIFLAGQVYDQNTQSLYHNFLYVQMGKRVTPDQFSKAMSQETERYCGVSLGVSDWRQISKNMMHTFIKTSLEPSPPSNLSQNIGDLAASHTTAIAQHWYARDVATLPDVSQDVMDAYQVFCEHWHAVLEFGDLPCPTPSVQQLDAHNLSNNPLSNQDVVSQTSTIEKLQEEVRETREENKKNMETILKKLSETEEENRTIKETLMELLQEVRSLKPPLTPNLDHSLSEGVPGDSEQELEYE